MSQYYRSVCGVLIVYDVSNRKSFENASYWLKQVDEHAYLGVHRLLIANKCDLTYQRNVPTGEGENFATENNLKYIETSAKTDKNVKMAFQNLAFDIFLDVKNRKIVADNDASLGVKVGDYLIEEVPRREKSNKLDKRKVKKKEKEGEKEGKKGCCK